MNKVILMGRLTRDPEIRYFNAQDGAQQPVARYTLAVDRRFSRNREGSGEQSADFISCKAWRHQAEFAEKYLRKGVKIAVTGRIETGSYTNKEGQKVYTTEVVVEEQEFAESKGSSQGSSGLPGGAEYSGSGNSGANVSDDFMNVPDGIDEELPFA